MDAGLTVSTNPETSWTTALASAEFEKEMVVVLSRAPSTCTARKGQGQLRVSYRSEPVVTDPP